MRRLTIDDGPEVFHVPNIIIVRTTRVANFAENFLTKADHDVGDGCKQVDDECKGCGGSVSSSCELSFRQGFRRLEN
jgi:hypothetical protein